MTDHQLTARALRRALIEDHGLDQAAHDSEIGSEVLLATTSVIDKDTLDDVLDLEREHPGNLLAQTMVAPRDAVTEIAPPDVEALLAAFNRPQETP